MPAGWAALTCEEGNVGMLGVVGAPGHAADVVSNGLQRVQLQQARAWGQRLQPSPSLLAAPSPNQWAGLPWHLGPPAPSLCSYMSPTSHDPPHTSLWSRTAPPVPVLWSQSKAICSREYFMHSSSSLLPRLFVVCPCFLPAESSADTAVISPCPRRPWGPVRQRVPFIPHS